MCLTVLANRPKHSAGYSSKYLLNIPSRTQKFVELPHLSRILRTFRNTFICYEFGQMFGRMRKRCGTTLSQ